MNFGQAQARAAVGTSVDLADMAVAAVDLTAAAVVAAVGVAVAVTRSQEPSAAQSSNPDEVVDTKTAN